MKIAIIGVGSVGSAIATAVQKTGLAHEIVLFDRDGVRARAAAEDLGHASAFSYDIKITAVSNYRGIRGSDIVIIAAGANQRIGETRMDLLAVPLHSRPPAPSPEASHAAVNHPAGGNRGRRGRSAYTGGDRGVDGRPQPRGATSGGSLPRGL